MAAKRMIISRFSFQHAIEQQAPRLCFDAKAMGLSLPRPLCKKKTHNMFYLLAYILDNGSGAEIAFLGATTRVWLKN